MIKDFRSPRKLRDGFQVVLMHPFNCSIQAYTAFVEKLLAMRDSNPTDISSALRYKIPGVPEKVFD